jgi:hypothetical protein
VDLVDRFQETMKHNKSVTEREQTRADESEVGKFTQEKLMDQSIESKVTKLVAISTFLTNAQEMGNSKLKEGLSEMMLVMARSDKYIIQELVASEAIIADASKKKDVTAIVNQGLGIIQPSARVPKTT